MLVYSGTIEAKELAYTLIFPTDIKEGEESIYTCSGLQGEPAIITTVIQKGKVTKADDVGGKISFTCQQEQDMLKGTAIKIVDVPTDVAVCLGKEWPGTMRLVIKD
ncbi:hypothetical protein N7517_003643 [Penicillium concentricum]|uniref:Uncharacterized protein n=1 Tax=Penicillium concentricum TaxID=293559 RepID=A0A9W9V7H9_9EURO|nr:uncharacterized protein N7517_003643 [Penicillium concentricum]KAJ5371637.1 hypothetical protein N7517_003643 [Penicillium concentricum]